VFRALMLQQGVLHSQHSASHAKVKKCVDNEEHSVKNNVNFIKDVPTIYVNFIFTETIDKKKKKLEALLS
jgi:hypothetical protein